MVPVIRIDDEVMKELKKRAIGLDLVFDSPNNVLRKVLGLDVVENGFKTPHKARKVRLAELVKKGLLSDGQVLYFFHGQPFTDERAQVIASSNQLKYEGNSRPYSVSELSKNLLEKHGFKHEKKHGVRGPLYWQTKDGRLLHELNEQMRSDAMEIIRTANSSIK